MPCPTYFPLLCKSCSRWDVLIDSPVLCRINRRMASQVASLVPRSSRPSLATEHGVPGNNRAQLEAASGLGGCYRSAIHHEKVWHDGVRSIASAANQILLCFVRVSRRQEPPREI